MALTYSEPIPLGTPAPPFSLPVANPDVDGRPGDTRSLKDFADAEALVVAFICNHCPYVHAVEERTVALARAVAPRVAFVAVSANDAERYPTDSFEEMAARAVRLDYPFPYLYDETQEVARAYDAVCTPDYYLFGRDTGEGRPLVYHGRLDDGRPGQEPTTADLGDAIEAYLETGAVPQAQPASMGCSIKWKPAA